MKLCWDNIENIRLSGRGNFRDIVKKQTYYLKVCTKCNEEYLGVKSDLSCSIYCASKRKHTKETKKKLSLLNIGKNNPNYGKPRSKETKRKIGLSNKNKTITDDIRKKISKTLKKEWKNPNSVFNSEDFREKLSISGKNKNTDFAYKQKYRKRGIPIYDTYAHQLEWCEEVRRNEQDPNMLEVRCFKCNEWFVPTYNNVRHRCQYLKNTLPNENKFYCSDQCKNSCSIFGKSTETIMKEDAVRAGRLPWLELEKEVQGQLRQMVLERNEYKCTKCGSITNDLHCHHILPVNIEPLLSADTDNCTTLCSKCHKEVHKKDGCNYGQLKVEGC